MLKRLIIVGVDSTDVDILTAVLAPFYQEWEIAAAIQGESEALEYLQTHSVDLVFWGTAGTGVPALDATVEFMKMETPFVLVSRTEGFALKAFELSALDFLLMPVSSERMALTLSKYEAYEARLVSGLPVETIQKLILGQPKTATPFSSIMVNNQNTVELIFMDDLAWCEAKGPYTNFHKTDGRVIMATKPLKYYEPLLADHGFFRLHRSYMINIKVIVSIDKAVMAVKLKSGQDLPVGPDRLSRFIETFRNWMDRSVMISANSLE